MSQLREMHFPVPATSADDGGLVRSLLGLSQLQQLTVDLYLGERATFDTLPEEHDDEFLETFVPLFPHARTIDIEFYGDDDLWLGCLGTNAASLTGLQALHIRCSTMPQDDVGLGLVLASMGVLTSLRELNFCADIDLEQNLPGDDELRDVFNGALRRLTGLTSLRMSTGNRRGIHRSQFPSRVLFATFLPHVTCLQSLQKLQVPADVMGEQGLECGWALAALSLKTLLVDRADGGLNGVYEPVHVRAVLDVVTQLTELRTLTFMYVLTAEEVAETEIMLSDLPTCQYEPFQEYMA